MNEPSWLADCLALPSLEMDIILTGLGHDLYYGPDGKGNETYGMFRDDLEQPRFLRKHTSVAAMSEIIGHEAELAVYYERLLLLARQYELPFARINGYFCLTAQFRNEASDVSFGLYEPRTSKYAGINRVLDEISSKEAGWTHKYYEQGWSFECYAKDGRLYVRENGDDEDEIYAVISFDRHSFLREVARMKERTTAVIAELTRLLGADAWTTYVWQPNFHIYRNAQN